MMAKISFEDETGSIGGVLFSAALEGCVYRPEENDAVLIKGNLFKKDGNASFAVQSITQLSDLICHKREILYVNVPMERESRSAIMEIFSEANIGPTKVVLCEKPESDQPARIIRCGYHSITIGSLMKLHQILSPDAIIFRDQEKPKNPMLIEKGR